jgi:hypothetical protein
VAGIPLERNGRHVRAKIAGTAASSARVHLPQRAAAFTLARDDDNLTVARLVRSETAGRFDPQLRFSCRT